MAITRIKDNYVFIQVGGTAPRDTTFANLVGASNIAHPSNEAIMATLPTVPTPTPEEETERLVGRDENIVFEGAVDRGALEITLHDLPDQEDAANKITAQQAETNNDAIVAAADSVIHVVWMRGTSGFGRNATTGLLTMASPKGIAYYFRGKKSNRSRPTGADPTSKYVLDINLDTSARAEDVS